jgi:hypothetical protein
VLSNWCYQPILIVTAGGKDVVVIQNWKVDPRCPNAGNPFHICAQYCYDHLNEAAQSKATKSGVFFFVYPEPANELYITVVTFFLRF